MQKGDFLPEQFVKHKGSMSQDFPLSLSHASFHSVCTEEEDNEDEDIGEEAKGDCPEDEGEPKPPFRSAPFPLVLLLCCSLALLSLFTSAAAVCVVYRLSFSIAPATWACLSFKNSAFVSADAGAPLFLFPFPLNFPFASRFPAHLVSFPCPSSRLSVLGAGWTDSRDKERREHPPHL